MLDGLIKSVIWLGIGFTASAATVNIIQQDWMFAFIFLFLLGVNIFNATRLYRRS